MIPAAFDYERASSIDEAVGLLTEHGDEAKLIAGGHSLLPLMKLRLATPSVLIDLGGIADLAYISDRGDQLAIGALSTHHQVATDPLVLRHLPLLAHVAAQVGILRCVTAGPSAAPSPTATPPRTCLPSSLPSAARSS